MNTEPNQSYKQKLAEREADPVAYDNKVKAECEVREKAEAEKLKAVADAILDAMVEAETKERLELRAEITKAEAEVVKAQASIARASAKEADANAREAEANAREAEANADEAKTNAEEVIRCEERSDEIAKSKAAEDAKTREKEDARLVAVRARHQSRLKTIAKADEYSYMAEGDRPRLVTVGLYEQYNKGKYYTLVGDIGVVINAVTALIYEEDGNGRSDTFYVWLSEKLCKVMLSNGGHVYTDHCSARMIGALIENPKRAEE